MISASFLEDGDVLIHRGNPETEPAFVLLSVPGPDQFGCATGAEAERLARSYAAHAGVNVWSAASPNELTLIACFRRSTRHTPPSAESGAARSYALEPSYGGARP